MAAPEADLVGQSLLGKLRVIRRIGEGATSVVYEVELGLDAFYRLRRVLRRMVVGPGASGRFWSERRCLAAGDVLRKGIEGFVSASALLRLVEWSRVDR